MIRNNYNRYILMLFTGVLFTGCSKFMEKDSQDLSYVKNASQLEEILNGEAYEKHVLPESNPLNYFSGEEYYFSWANLMDDDVAERVTDYSYGDGRTYNFGFYTWQRNPFVMRDFTPYEDNMWPRMYKLINAANIVIKQTELLNDDPARLKRIKGEAEFLRAGYYFQMVNFYAKAYNKATAAVDPGVPLKITEYVEDKFFTRSTVDSVYQQIVSDLASAENDLSDGRYVSYYHADINAVNLLQSRVYLYMQDYEKALQAADKVIARKPQLSNLAAHKPQTSFFSGGSPETIFTMGGNSLPYIMEPDNPETLAPSDELLSLYKAGDYRRDVFFTTDYLGKSRYAKVYWDYYNMKPEIFSDNFFLRNAEAYLNKAEALAMLGNEGEARKTIDILRKTRIAPAYFSATVATGSGLVNAVREERRRELCFEGHRWFDLKRYAVNEKYPFSRTIIHTYSECQSGGVPYVAATLKLLPNDPAYVIPIPQAAISFNQGSLIQNPERPDRTFQ